MTGRWPGLVATVRQGFRPGLTVAGLVCLTSAAWDLARPAGLAVAGLAFLLFEFLLDEPAEEKGD